MDIGSQNLAKPQWRLAEKAVLGRVSGICPSRVVSDGLLTNVVTAKRDKWQSQDGEPSGSKVAASRVGPGIAGQVEAKPVEGAESGIVPRHDRPESLHHAEERNPESPRPARPGAENQPFVPSQTANASEEPQALANPSSSQEHTAHAVPHPAFSEETPEYAAVPFRRFFTKCRK